MKSTAPPSELDLLLGDLEESGMSAAAFARERRIPVQRLYGAMRRNRRKTGKPEMEAFGEVSVVDAPEFQAAQVELKLPSGVSICVTRDFDEVSLRRLLTVMESC